MTSIQFYVVNSNQTQARFKLACRLAQKAYESNMRTYIHCSSYRTAQYIDTLLWRFDEASFLPHSIINQDDSNNPILIGYNIEPHDHSDYLINLTQKIPHFLDRFSRMAEILNQSPEVLSLGRERYKHYRQKGYSLDYYTPK